MQDTSKNIQTNKDHYDEFYSKTNVDSIIAKLNDLDRFLSDATLTDTSWHGMYFNDFAGRIKGKKVFEVGSGDGLNALIMAKLGAEVTANDVSKQSGRIIQEISSKLGIQNIDFVSGDFRQIPVTAGSFDFVIGKAFLHHLTHELESEFLARTASLLKANGEARFFEPATNSQTLDKLRWMVPVPGRPSNLNKRAFAEWKTNDPHPDRDNSSDHYINSGERFFAKVEVVPIGTIERFCRLLPEGKLNRKYRRWAHRVQPRLPFWLRHNAARSQLIIYQQPKVQNP
jgi:2-polyprenyl-3-methyl-5-hydroxy-6-metoxy-1,4-benzoquinol methylase